MSLNKICVAILNDLVNANSYVKVSDLANKYKLTDRAIRYNLDKIEKFLLKNGFTYLDKQHVKGVKILKDPKLEEFVIKFSGEYTPYKYIYSKEEKFKMIVTKLLEAENPIRLDYFQSKLYISKNTLLKDLTLVEQYLKGEKLCLIRKPRIGLYVEGDELCKRKVLNSLVSQTISLKDIYSYMKRNETLSKINNFQFETLFSNIDIDFINRLIVQVENELEREFNDEAYGNLITHIAIMIKRIQLCKNIYLPEVDIASILNTKEYAIAQKMVLMLEKHYNIKVPKEELGYITLRFLGAKMLKNYKKVDENAMVGLHEVAETMTKEIEEIYNVSFEPNRKKIIDGLVLHLRPTIYRIRFNLSLENPIFDDIADKYKQLLLNSKYVSRHLQEYIGKEVNVHEISYIALHFGAALENARIINNALPRVVLVCGTGVGTAMILATQLAKTFHIEIVNTVSTRAILRMETSDYDLIISTIDIPEFHTDNYIKVNAILTKYDYEKLKKYLSAKNTIFNYEENTKKVNYLIEAVAKHCEIKDPYVLQYEFMKILLADKENILPEEKIKLQDLIKNDSLLLKCECNNWKDAIELGANLLLGQKTVKEGYGKAIINAIEQLGPYMVIAPGVVLSHGRPEDGALKLSMSLVTLKQGVSFGDDFKENVKLIITLAAVDKESHVKALAQLMELIKSKKDIRKIINANNKEEVLEIIRKYSQMNVNF